MWQLNELLIKSWPSPKNIYVYIVKQWCLSIQQNSTLRKGAFTISVLHEQWAYIHAHARVPCVFSTSPTSLTTSRKWIRTQRLLINSMWIKRWNSRWFTIITRYNFPFKSTTYTTWKKIDASFDEREAEQTSNKWTDAVDEERSNRQKAYPIFSFYSHCTQSNSLKWKFSIRFRTINKI